MSHCNHQNQANAVTAATATTTIPPDALYAAMSSDKRTMMMMAAAASTSSSAVEYHKVSHKIIFQNPPSPPIIRDSALWPRIFRTTGI